MSGQLHDPAALPPEKEPLVPIVQEAGWAPEPGPGPGPGREADHSLLFRAEVKNAKSYTSTPPYVFKA
jgi:hypothetical protein